MLTTGDIKWPAWSAANEQLLSLVTRDRAEGNRTKRMDFMTTSAVVVRLPPRGVPGQPRDWRVE
jgi:hypothetical protein